MKQKKKSKTNIIMSELLKRGVFGAIYIALVVLSLWLDSPALFLGLFSFFIFVGIWEYETMFELNRTRPLRKILDGVAAVYLFLATYLIMRGGVEVSALKLFLPYLAYLIFIFVRAIYSDRELMPNDIAMVIFGQVYVAGLFTCAIPLYTSLVGSIILLFIFVCIWLNDTGAYIFGSKFGKRRLFPSVSPKKSWEGFWGGFATVLVGAVVFSQLFSVLSLDWYSALFLGAIISVASTWGDLFESMLKRSAGVKDSGSIIPGHGGVLDRLDSFMFAAPAVLLALLCTI